MLTLEDRWLWDFWFARDGDDYHRHLLQPPRSMGDPDERHWNASIGHAVSQDLRAWSVLPDALAPGDGTAGRYQHVERQHPACRRPVASVLPPA